MNTKNRLELVKEFMLSNGQTVENLPTPHIPDKIKKLRVSLIEEELKELETAFENNDIVEIADALADLEYVLLGAVLSTGLEKLFVPIFEEIHKNNMTKLCNSYEEAQDTVGHYSLQHGSSTYIEELPELNKWAVKRSSDGKLMKSIMYKSVNLNPFFDGENNNITQFDKN